MPRSAPRLEALLALHRLEALPRTGWLQVGIRPAESVAAHSHGMALLALALGPEVDPPLDLGRVLQMVAIHDAPEALLGDWPRAAAELLPPGAKAAAEGAAAERLLGPLPPLVQAAFEEYRQGTSREARFARLCDRLQLGLRAVAYQRAGWRGLGEFRSTLAELSTAEFPGAEALRIDLLAELDGTRDR